MNTLKIKEAFPNLPKKSIQFKKSSMELMTNPS